MPKTSLTKLIETIESDYPAINLVRDANSFSWRSHSQSITYNPNDPDAPQLLLHELGHAIKQHDNYNTDIQLLRMEREAWIEAQQVAHKYSISLDEDFIESSLDSYREWIHRKSTCPNCNSNGFQNVEGKYICPLCQKSWIVNDGLICRIYRRQT